MSTNEKPCKYCGKAIMRHPRMKGLDWLRKTYCSTRCRIDDRAKNMDIKPS